MNTIKIKYTIKTSSRVEIQSHLKKCNDNFNPPLSEKINIEEYSKKIFKKSITFEAWNNNVLIGLVAAYFNDIINCLSFITNVSVIKEYTGLGVASTLIKDCIKYAEQHKFKEIRLTVQRNNNSAIKLYKKFGFTYLKKKNNSILMHLINLNL